MGHNLFKNTMAYVGETPWHRLGKAVPPTVTAPEMIRAANLDWDVYKKPAPGARQVGKDRAYNRYLLCRGRVDGEASDVALGMVGRQYTIIQNRDAFQFFEPLIRSGWAHSIQPAPWATGSGSGSW
jgi:hypothetical protein